jgi:hypothetical protein
MSELYARCLAKALKEKLLVYPTRDRTKDSELTRKMERHPLNVEPVKPIKSKGSCTSRCSALNFAVPVMEMPESEPVLVGVAEKYRRG